MSHCRLLDAVIPFDDARQLRFDILPGEDIDDAERIRLLERRVRRARLARNRWLKARSELREALHDYHRVRPRPTNAD